MPYPDKINALVDIAGTSTLAAVGHAARHNDVNDALDELKVVLTVPAANTLALAPGGTERLRITSAGNVLVGAASALSNVGEGVSYGVQNVSTGGAANILQARFSSDANGPGFYLLKSRSASIGGLGIVQSGDILGKIVFSADDGVDYAQAAASISAAVDGTPGANDMPGRLMFFTAADGTTTLSERMRIDNAGLITGSGTSLGAWTAYTPTLGGTGWALGNGTATGAYCQIGKVVHFRAGYLFGSTSTFGAVASPTVSLPVAAISGTNGAFNIVAKFYDASANSFYFAYPVIASATTFTITTLGTNGVQTQTNATTPFTWATSDQLLMYGTYEAA